MQRSVRIFFEKYFILICFFIIQVYPVHAQHTDSNSVKIESFINSQIEKNQIDQISRAQRINLLPNIPERISGSSVELNYSQQMYSEVFSGSDINFTCSNAVGCQNPDYLVAYYSSTNSGYTISDQFVPLSSGPVTSVCWYGVYFNSNLGIDCQPGPGDDFLITYLYDDGGEPGDTLAGPFSVNPLKSLTGNFLPVGSVAVYGYDAIHPSVNVIPHQLYWISIKNNILTGDCRWGWVTSAQGDNFHYLNGSFVQADDLAFCLNVPIKPDGGISAAPPNDVCVNSKEISVDTIISTSTLNATTQDAPAFCFTPLNTGPGIWFHFSGTGNKVELTTCHQGTNFDTKLAVFSGTCGNLTCIAGNDDMGSSACSFSPDHSKVEFCTTAGNTYYIYLTGYGQNSGNAILKLNSVMSAPPVIVQCPQDITQNNTPGLCEAFVNIPEPLSGVNFTDDCGAFIYNDMNFTSNASGVFQVGTTQVTWTIEDFDGQMVSCIQNITVVDIDLPLIDCPPDTVVETDPGSSFATGVVFVPPVVSDNCGIMSVTHDGVEPYPVGTTVITWTVTDMSGNSEICYQALEVTPYVGLEVAEIQSDFLNVVPIPATDRIEINIGLHQSSSVRIEISDIHGKNTIVIVDEPALSKGVHYYIAARESLGLQNGMYFITLFTEQGKTTRKIIFK